MIRAGGFLLVVVALGWAGLVLARSFSRRQSELEQVVFALRLLETEMVYGRQNLDQAFLHVASRLRGEVAQVFAAAGAALGAAQGLAGEEAFAAALAAREPFLSLGEGEKEMLREFGVGLGLSDIGDQRVRLQFFQRRAEALAAEAAAQCRRWQKLYAAGGWFCGLVLALFLL